MLVPIMYLVNQLLMKIKLDEKYFIYMFCLETNRNFINSHKRQHCIQLWVKNMNPEYIYMTLII